MSALDDILEDYKYKDLSLSQAINKIHSQFSFISLRTASLDQELAYILADYKFKAAPRKKTKDLILTKLAEKPNTLDPLYFGKL